jgi:multidrug efflux pump subunit AcrB
MWIVKLAMDRPYTFIEMALQILLLSPIAILRTPVDMFPNINIKCCSAQPSPIAESKLLLSALR